MKRPLTIDATENGIHHADPLQAHDSKYLGDGVYVSNDGFHVILSTSNGLKQTNVILLDPQVISQLKRYIVELEATPLRRKPACER
jgi:hypothetical protein